MKLNLFSMVFGLFFCASSSLAVAQNEAIGGLQIEQPRDMRAMILEFTALQPGVVPGLADLAARPGTGDLEDTTITCNNGTGICTCVSDEDGDCVAKLGALCDDAHEFGSDGGVGTDCPQVE